MTIRLLGSLLHVHNISTENATEQLKKGRKQENLTDQEKRTIKRLTFTLFALACGNILFSSLFAAGDVSRKTSPAAKSEEKRMFSQAMFA